MFNQALVAEPAVEAFGVGVPDLLHLLNEGQLDVVIDRPRTKRADPKLTVIIEREADRFTRREMIDSRAVMTAVLDKLYATVIG
jgi:hypothetical protein